jgi:hypothetical protein
MRVRAILFTVRVNDVNVSRLDGEQKKSSTGENPIEDFDLSSLELSVNHHVHPV